MAWQPVWEKENFEFENVKLHLKIGLFSHSVRAELLLYIYIYICTHTHTHMYIYIYIHEDACRVKFINGPGNPSSKPWTKLFAFHSYTLEKGIYPTIILPTISK